MSFPIGLLQDNFTDNTQSPAWGGSGTTGSATTSETGGQAVITLPSSVAGSHSGFWRTSGRYDLTGDALSWNIGTMVATGVAATAFFQLITGDLTQQLLWRQLSNAITARSVVAGVDTQLFTATWSATTYKYLRIRESAGTIFWDSSTNGTSWTNRASVATPFAVTDLIVQFAASCGNVASPGALKLDDVNLILPAPSATWRETTADWSISNRLRPVTLASDGGKQGVIVTADSMDSSRVLSGNLHYYAGPLGSASGGFLALTEYASLVLAQASAFPIPIDGRVDLPAMVDARFMRLYHRSIDASAHLIYEYVPRRIVQSDDVEAESIRAINIAAHTITADQIATINLDALAQITAGAGAIKLNDQGISVVAEIVNVYNPQSAYSWYLPDGVTRIGDMYAAHEVNYNRVILEAALGAGDYAGEVTLFAEGTTGSNNVLINMVGGRAAIDPALTVNVANGSVLVTTDTFKISGELNVGTATGTGAGQISTSGSVAFGAAIASTVRLLLKGASTTSADYGIVCQNSTPGNTMYVRNDGAGFLLAASWTYGSDANRKQNIRAIGKDIRDFMLLEPKIFDYIDGPTDRMGYLAQDVQAIIPSIVETLPDGTLGMRTDEIGVLTGHVLRRLIRILIQKGVLVPSDIA